ncbi:MAG: radical SAM protein [Deltaproteobacteria bacterium]|nr:radical SAM protein [Deltaproteobacteria bacterium]
MVEVLDGRLEEEHLHRLTALGGSGWKTGVGASRPAGLQYLNEPQPRQPSAERPLLNVACTAVTEDINGPGRRFTVWVQGCARRCPDCFNPALQPHRPAREVSPAELAREVLEAGPLDGVTLSGGEPFEQAAELAAFLDEARTRDGPLTAIAFTGYEHERLREGPPAHLALLSRLDLLVDGPFRSEESASLPLRGSANQRLIPLTAAGEGLRTESLRLSCTGYQVIISEEGDVLLTGFPPQDALRALGALR